MVQSGCGPVRTSTTPKIRANDVMMTGRRRRVERCIVDGDAFFSRSAPASRHDVCKPLSSSVRRRAARRDHEYFLQWRQKWTALSGRVTALFESILALLLDSSIKGTLLLSLATVVSFTLRKSSAAARHKMWALTIGTSN